MSRNQIIECVPNFSEGRDEGVIEALVSVVRKTDGCTVLDVDPGKSTNRTVLTFIGNADAVINGAFNLCKAAKENIDMSKHSGEHPRMGAVDVCPFIPVSNCTMDDCVEVSKIFAKRCGDELGLPMYLYEHSQPLEYRKKLPQIREGQYEAIPQRIFTEKWKPDFGPAKFVHSYGATVTGARMFLIAYNVNILGTKEQCHRIALDVREAGRKGQKGKFKDVKGIGWYVDEYNMAQVSLNLNNYKVSPMHVVFEECKRIAASLNLACIGSELVGLVPLEAFLDAADYYCKKENLFIVDEAQRVKLVIDRLGLNSCSPFIPEKRIVEYIVRGEANEPLAQASVRNFVEILGSRTPAPGGGSASALVAAIGAALGVMAAWLTYGKRRFEAKDKIIRENIPPLHYTMKDLISMIDADTNAFNDYMAARKLPRKSDEEKKHREEEMQKGLKSAISVPLGIMECADQCWNAMMEIAKHGNPGCKSDVQVGARALEVGIWGAYQNVLTNLPDISDKAFVDATRLKARNIHKRAVEECSMILKFLETETPVLSNL